VTLPASFLRDGFLSPDLARRGGRKFRRLMIGSDGPSDSGKTEFMLSIPGPGMALALDRGFDAIFDNPNPPPTRRDDWAMKVINAPKNSAMNQEAALRLWNEFKEPLYKALENPDCRAVCIDGDSDSWEMQRLAEFGRLAKVPSHLYDGINAARRTLYARCFDSGKIILATNKIRRVYADKIDPATGKPELNNSGNVVRVWNGEYERQGFGDQDYLWAIQLRHMKHPTELKWGVRITKCKADPSLVGMELWGENCNFLGLVQTVYPHIDPKEWGF
jgi:hypothetical protein